jgi:hypothetical protein
VQLEHDMSDEIDQSGNVIDKKKVEEKMIHKPLNLDPRTLTRKEKL